MAESTIERLVGVDFGTVRIGLAFAHTEVGIATSIGTYQRQNETADTRYFKKLAEEERVDRFIVGLPVHTDGSESRISHQARQFANWLSEVTGKPHELFDERYTSLEAEEVLLAAGLSKKKRKARLDGLAAQNMLTAYLEANSTRRDQPKPLDD